MAVRDFKACFGQFLVASLVGWAILAACGYALYRANMKNVERLEAGKSSQEVSTMEKLMEYEFEGMVADVRLLSNMRESREIFASRMAADLAKNLLFFALDKKAYDNIRYLDTEGMELFRINYRHGNPAVVPRGELHSRKGTYYFKGSQRLKVGGVYISRLEPDMESGERLGSAHPVMRLAAPLFSDTGERQGVVMLNFFGDHLLRIMEIGTDRDCDNAMLLNGDGYWLHSEDPSDEWGFIRRGCEDVNFKARYPQEWAEARKLGAGQLRTDNGLFTFVTLDPGEIISEQAGIEVVSEAGQWIIMLHVGTSIFEEASSEYLRKMASLIIPLMLAVVVAVWMICAFRQKTKQAQRDIMEQHASYSRFVPKRFWNSWARGVIAI